MSGVVSFTFVWLSNDGSGNLTLTIAVRPSRTSSPVSASAFSPRMPCLRAKSLIVRVRAERKPLMCVPPSTVLMLFANEKAASPKVSLYCNATSIR